MKGKAIGYCIDKLESLSNSPAEQVAIIKQTIQNGWTDFFPLKRKNEKESGSNGNFRIYALQMAKEGFKRETA